MNRKIKLYGEELKRFILEGRIDKDKADIRSVRDFLREIGHTIGFSTDTSNYTFWCKRPEVVNSEPYKGKKITQELIRKYAKDMGYFDESVAMLKEIGERMEFSTEGLGDYIDRGTFKQTLIDLYGSSEYYKIKGEVKRLKRFRNGG